MFKNPFKSLFRFLFVTNQPPMVRDLPRWKDRSSCYITRFQDQIEDVARKLSEEGSLISARFNSDKKRAELYDDEGEVLAHFVSEGSECSPNSVIVTPLKLFTREEEKLFVTIMPGHTKFKEAA